MKDLNLDGTLDWRDLTTEKEEIWFLSDVNNDGIADKSQLYIADFNSEISDLANGVEYYDGNVFIPIGPDMWRTGDNNGDGIDVGGGDDNNDDGGYGGVLDILG